MEAQIIAILNDICGAEAGEIETDMNLFEEGLLDSFAIVQLMVALEEAFEVTLDIATLTREDIATPARIAQQVKRAQ